MRQSIDDIFNVLKISKTTAKRSVVNIHSSKEFTYTLAHFNWISGDAIIKMDTPMLHLLNRDIFSLSTFLAEIDITINNMSALVDSCKKGINSLTTEMQSTFKEIIQNSPKKGTVKPEEIVFPLLFNLIVKGENQEEFKELKTLFPVGKPLTISTATKKIDEVSVLLGEKLSSCSQSFEKLSHDFVCLKSILNDESLNGMLGLIGITDQNFENALNDFRVELEGLMVSVLEATSNFKNMLCFLTQLQNKNQSKSESEMNRNQNQKAKCDNRKLLAFISSYNFLGSNLEDYIETKSDGFKKSFIEAPGLIGFKNSEFKGQKDSKVISMEIHPSMIITRAQS